MYVTQNADVSKKATLKFECIKQLILNAFLRKKRKGNITR